MRKIREVTLVYKKWTRHSDGCCQTPSQLKTTLCVLGRSARYCTDHSWRRQPWSWTAGSGMGREGQERKEKEGWGCTTIHREKPGLDRGRGGKTKADHTGDRKSQAGRWDWTLWATRLHTEGL